MTWHYLEVNGIVVGLVLLAEMALLPGSAAQLSRQIILQETANKVVGYVGGTELFSFFFLS